MRPVNVTVGKQQNAFTLHHTVTPLSRIRGAILEGDIPFTDKSIKRRFVNTFVAENDTWANRDLKNNYKKNYFVRAAHFAKIALRIILLFRCCKREAFQVFWCHVRESWNMCSRFAPAKCVKSGENWKLSATKFFWICFKKDVVNIRGTIINLIHVYRLCRKQVRFIKSNPRIP